MRKKNWLIGSVAAAAVVICGAVGINSVKAADTDAAKSAKEEFVYEQVGLDSYNHVYGDIYGEGTTTWLTSDDDKKISIIGKDGTIYSIDNTDGKYGNIAVGSSAYLFDGYVYTSDSENKKTILNYDGSFAVNNGGYHDKADMFVVNGTKYLTFTDGDKTVIKSEDGTDVTDKLVIEGKKIENISSTAGILIKVEYSDKTIYYDTKFNEVDVTSKLAQDGFEIISISKYNKDYISVYYRKVGTEGKREPSYVKFFDLSLNQYADTAPFVSPSASSDIPKSVYAESNRLFSTSVSDEKKYSLEDGYRANSIGVLLGYKVILGSKTTEEYNQSKNLYRRLTSYAMFDENGVKLLDNVMQYSRVDKLVVKENDKYKIYAVSLKSASGETNITVDENKNSVAEVVAKEVDERELKDENGNKITVDDLDADAKAVMNQKFDFKLVAAENVIPEGTKLSVSKVVAGKEYAAAKTVTAEVAERVAVFNIDLLNTENVKVQPNGKLEITTDVPTGYDVSRIAVYRLSEDGTSYIKLESKVVDGKVVFETDHFSTYMIVEEKSEVTENPVINDGENPAANDGNQTASDDGTKGGNVQTGDIPMAGIIALIAVLALAGVSLVVSSKKSRA